MGPQYSHPENSQYLEQEYTTETSQPEAQTSLNAEPERIVECTKDEDFWYWDGNVVLLLTGIAFKLHASRLESYCGYFRELFSRGNLTGLAVEGDPEGCIAYYVPPELSTSSFKDLLRALDSPLEFVSDPPSQDLAISLLFAADTLACDLVLDLAKRRLAEIWDGHTLPATDNCNAEDRTHPSAICAIKLARRYAMPGILRRAFYELLSSQAFWDALGPRASQAALDGLRISEEDVRTLFSARVTLGGLWREFVMQVPEGTTYRSQRSPYDMRWCCYYDEKTRAGAWRSFVVDKGALELCDPLRYDFVAEWEGELRKEGKWCQACVDKKRRAAEEKRSELWERMDELFGL
ncbi:hypothetical protein V8D89_007044 [Ganoderma adspersum]